MLPSGANAGLRSALSEVDAAGQLVGGGIQQVNGKFVAFLVAGRAASDEGSIRGDRSPIAGAKDAIGFVRADPDGSGQPAWRLVPMHRDRVVDPGLEPLDQQVVVVANKFNRPRRQDLLGRIRQQGGGLNVEKLDGVRSRGERQHSAIRREAAEHSAARAIELLSRWIGTSPDRPDVQWAIGTERGDAPAVGSQRQAGNRIMRLDG